MNLKIKTKIKMKIKTKVKIITNTKKICALNKDKTIWFY